MGEVRVGEVFEQSECIDTIGVTKGKGMAGVIKRFRVTRLNRKSHRGFRKVACIGAWHPSAVKWTVARSGQKGFHHRTEINKKIYRIGRVGLTSHKASTEYDITDKDITPVGGFPRYGILKEDYIILKGSISGPVRCAVTLRKGLFYLVSRNTMEEIVLKFIDTSSKFGHGRFQTSEEKSMILGRLKL